MGLAHELTGHINVEDCRKTVKYLGYELSRGGLSPCESCAEAKAKMKNLPTRVQTVTTVVRPRVIPARPNDLVSLDISTIRAPKGVNVTVTKPNWRLIIDQRTQMKFSEFFATKDGMIEPTCEKFFKWQEAGMPVKVIRCDNARENIKLEDRLGSADWKLNIEFEYTARDTPQQNSHAEVGITTLLLRSKAMMIGANIAFEKRYKLFREAIATATQLDALIPMELDGVIKTRVEHWCGELPEYAHHLRTWGEAGVVKLKTKTTVKLQNNGTTCMFVGYAINHKPDVYRMWDPFSNRVHTSRDVIWLKKMFFVSNRKNGEATTHADESMEAGEDSEVEAPNTLTDARDAEEEDLPVLVNRAEDDEAEEIDDAEGDGEQLDEEEPEEEPETTTRSGRISRAPSYLKDYAVMALTKAEFGYYADLRSMVTM